MKNLKIVFVLSIIATILHLQGCVVAAVGAGIAAVKYGNAKKMEAKQGCLKNYNDYLKVAKDPIPLSKYCGDTTYTNSKDGK